MVGWLVAQVRVLSKEVAELRARDSVRQDPLSVREPAATRDPPDLPGRREAGSSSPEEPEGDESLDGQCLRYWLKRLPEETESEKVEAENEPKAAGSTLQNRWHEGLCL